MSSKEKQLAELNLKMKECSKCILRKTCQQVVPGEGSAEAEIMFIGEGPGKKEDETGRPFVGAAGKFLDEMLASVGLSREDACPVQSGTGLNGQDKIKSQSLKKNTLCGVYIANVVKCRPPENRDPLPEEARACWPWLEEQVRIIDPKIIVTLGRHSMERFLPGQRISEVHGHAMRKEIPGLGKRVFFTLYHPAAALYNGGMRQTLIQDFKKIPRLLKTFKKEEKE